LNREEHYEAAHLSELSALDDLDYKGGGGDATPQIGYGALLNKIS
jgi:hypothetical protein